MPSQRTTGNIGVDVGAQNHTINILDAKGDALYGPAAVPNDLRGLSMLEARLDELAIRAGIRRWVAGIESTTFGVEPLLTKFLLDHGCDLRLLTPREVQAQRYLDTRKGAKSDKNDSIALARLVFRGIGSPYKALTSKEKKLRGLIEERALLKRNRTSERRKAVSVMSENYRVNRKTAGNIIDTKTGVLFLRRHQYPPDVRGTDVNAFISEVKSTIAGTYRSVLKHLYEVCSDVWSQSYSPLLGTDPFLLYYLDKMAQSDREIATLTEQVGLILADNNDYKLLRTIPGIGKETGSVIQSRIPDIRRFSHWKKLERFSGLDLVQDTSGPHEGRAKISKHGDPLLRKAVFDSVGAAIRLRGAPENNGLRTRYQSILRRRGSTAETRRKAQIKLAVRQLRIIWAVIHRGEPYVEEERSA